MRAADVLVMGVPSHGFRATLERGGRPYLRPWVPVVSLAKGLEQGTKLRMTQIIERGPAGPPGAACSPGRTWPRRSWPATRPPAWWPWTTTTSPRALQQLFATELFRVYTNPDVIGCELGGVLKNVIAIASGMADGLGTGDNTRAAVITRGLPR